MKIYKLYLFDTLEYMIEGFLEMFFAGNLSMFGCCVLTNPAGNTKDFVQAVSKAACWNLDGRQSLSNQLTIL